MSSPDASAMVASFLRLGFTEGADLALVEVQGINDLYEVEVPDDGRCGSLCRTLCSVGGADPAHKVLAKAESNLMLAAFWLHHMTHVSCPQTLD